MKLNYHGREIFYQINGNGPAIVLIHGFLESSTMWEKLVPVLSNNKTVIRIDLPGFGKSESIDEVHSMELMADMVYCVIRDLKIDQTSILGHSMGGYVALAFVEKHAEKTDKLILLNSTPAADTQERNHNRDRGLALAIKHRKVYIDMAIDNLFTEASRHQFSYEIKALKEEAQTLRIEDIKAAIIGMKERKDRTLILKAFKNKKYMFSGIYDPIMPFNESNASAKESDTPIIKLKSGHMSLTENYTDFIKYMHFID